MNEWISVYDALPKIGQPVLLLVVARTGAAFYETSNFRGKDEFGLWWGTPHGRYNYEEETIYWRELPPPPEGITVNR